MPERIKAFTSALQTEMLARGNPCVRCKTDRIALSSGDFKVRYRCAHHHKQEQSRGQFKQGLLLPGTPAHKRAVRGTVTPDRASLATLMGGRVRKFIEANADGRGLDGITMGPKAAAL